jgi:hypothetical protein
MSEQTSGDETAIEILEKRHPIGGPAFSSRTFDLASQKPLPTDLAQLDGNSLTAPGTVIAGAERRRSCSGD